MSLNNLKSMTPFNPFGQYWINYGPDSPYELLRVNMIMRLCSFILGLCNV